jgi:leucyl/phenylalanyl-tRNA--protein transferase
MTIQSDIQAGGNKLYWVAENVTADDFPDVSCALRDPDGLLAIGGDLETGRLLDAYRRGIFPWYSQGQPILWWSPDPRCVLKPDEIHISRSLAKTLRQGRYRVTFNQAFDQVIRKCAGPRKGVADTWITPDIINAYTALYEHGHILSAACWCGDELVGGLYGVVIGKVYFGESMFSTMTDASKVAMVHLGHLLQLNNFRLIDCQVYSRHLNSMGARPIPRNLFINILKSYCDIQETYNWPRQSTFT